MGHFHRGAGTPDRHRRAERLDAVGDTRVVLDVGVDQARPERVHPDAVMRHLAAEALGQDVDAALGGTIGDEAAGAEQCRCLRRDVDDRPALAAPRQRHPPHRLAVADQVRGEVDIDDPADFLDRDVGQWRRLVDHPGIADEGRDRAELGLGHIEHPHHGAGVVDIALDGHRPPPGGTDVIRHPFGGRRIAGIVDRHVIAACRREGAAGGADAAAAARDQNDPAHCRSP